MRSLPLLALLAVGCGSSDRPGEVSSVFARADEALFRTRRALTEGKYARMTEAPYAFFRGSAALFAHDVRSGAIPLPKVLASLPIVPSLGDAHLENFGVLIAPDGSLALEPNDLDAADRWPAWVDLVRLSGSLALAAQLSNPDDPDARAALVGAVPQALDAMASAYVASLVSSMAGAPPPAAQPGEGGPLVVDLFERAAKDLASRDELVELTELVDGARRLRRGTLDPSEPWGGLVDAPAWIAGELPDVLARYATTLASPPPPSELAVRDAARLYGSGVASYPRVRLLVLVEGPTPAPEDDRILELKEIADSGARAFVPPGLLAGDLPGRVAAARGLWSRPDADGTWGTSELRGLPLQIREERAGAKTLRVARLEGNEGTPEALLGVAGVLGTTLGRVHGSTAFEAFPAGSWASELDETALGEALRALGPALAAAAFADGDALVSARAALGPALGVPYEVSDAPDPDWAALFEGGLPPQLEPSP